ncbi:MAG: IS21 family transposase, partial [Gammaproteobacteria bacterium]|nr:IS21 family transposase [Gammaproteobacteria bacterium]MYJ21489.1 IS21 family transposase [Rhodothermaceae bacterium]
TTNRRKRTILYGIIGRIRYFCRRYKQWCRSKKVTMRLHHKAGEKLYVDFAGKTIEVIDPETGQITKAQIFVATMGGSNYTYVEAVPDPTLRSWIGVHVRCLELFGALPRVVVCDNLNAAVTRARRKNPVVNETYKDFARHYDLMIDPARVRRAQDKAVVEVAVKHITTHVLTALDPRQFFSIAELNEAVAPLLEPLNTTPFQKKMGTRKNQFEELDLPAMRPLPEYKYRFRAYKKLKVNMNYHVHANGGYYSVPYRYVHKSLDVWISEHLVECYDQTKHVATHERLAQKGADRTVEEPIPPHPRRYRDRERILSRARSVGSNTAKLVASVLERRPHPDTVPFKEFWGCGNERLEALRCRWESAPTIIQAWPPSSNMDEINSGNRPLSHRRLCMRIFAVAPTTHNQPSNQRMNHHSTLEQLAPLRFHGMASALRDQLAQPDIERLSFLERLGLLLARELSDREIRSLTARLRRAKLHQNACMEYRASRGLDQQQMLQLASCNWIKRHLNVIITGPTGTGKSFLACALAHKACLEGFRARYHRLPRLLEELSVARADGRYLKILDQLRKLDVLDDWGLIHLCQAQQEDLFQLLDDRIQKRSTIATSQLPVEHWHQNMANPTIADALLDRLVQPAYRIELKGDSLRKQLAEPSS